MNEQRVWNTFNSGGKKYKNKSLILKVISLFRDCSPEIYRPVC